MRIFDKTNNYPETVHFPVIRSRPIRAWFVEREHMKLLTQFQYPFTSCDFLKNHAWFGSDLDLSWIE